MSRRKNVNQAIRVFKLKGKRFYNTSCHFSLYLNQYWPFISGSILLFPIWSFTFFELKAFVIKSVYITTLFGGKVFQITM